VTSAERVAAVVPVDDLPRAVTAWSALLGSEPTFVDGDRWAQFDVAGGGRIALAGTDRFSDRPGAMVKVADVTAARDAAVASGWIAGDPETGPHEVRCVLHADDGTPVVIYSSLPDRKI
jgi:hypothetical protein